MPAISAAGADATTMPAPAFPEITRLPVPVALVGESPRWHAEHGCLYYVDIFGRQLRAYWPETGAYRAWDFSALIGGWFPTDGPALLLCLGTKLALFDPATEVLTVLIDILPGANGLRLNDGRCDARGRLLISTMSTEAPPAERVGHLFRYAAGEAPQLLMEGLTIPNTLAWAPDGRLYFSDSPTQRVMRHPYDLESGTLGPGETFFAFDPGDPGIPDGACTDTEGRVWIAVPRAGRIERRLPDGTRDLVVPMPAERPTMCAFGGADMQTLFVTSLSRHLPAERSRPAMADGALFALRPGGRGVEENRFALG